VSYVDDLVAGIELGLSEATNGLNQLQSVGPRIIHVLVDTTLDTVLPVPEVAKNRIADLLITDLMESIQFTRDAVKQMEKYAHMLGSPDALRAAASTIENSIDTASGDLASDMRPDSLKAMMDDSKWAGGASQLYAKSFIDQNDAASRIATYGAVMEDSLGKLADGIEQFYVELAVAVATFVAAILTAIGAIITAATVVGAPFGIGLAIAACVSALASLGSVIAMWITISQEVSDDIGGLHSHLKPWPTAQFAS